MVCEPCRAALPQLAQRCARCAVPLPQPGLCGQCRRAPPHFDAACAAYEYRFPLDRLLQRFKYAGDLAIGRWLALELAHAVREHPPVDLLIPVPLAPARLRERGFNQAVEIARVVSRRIDVPLPLRWVERTREAPSQSGLGRRARRANLRGAFRCHGALHGKRVALVDDVVTTGATANALAMELKRAGAARVDVWAVARTPEPGER